MRGTNLADPYPSGDKQRHNRHCAYQSDSRSHGHSRRWLYAKDLSNSWTLCLEQNVTSLGSDAAGVGLTRIFMGRGCHPMT